MDSVELKAAQAPLKARYRDDPAAALVTLRAEGTLGDESVACRVSTGRALVEAGLHPATGGTGLLACSGDMLLEALVACAGVTLRAVATSLGLDVRGHACTPRAISTSAARSASGRTRTPGRLHGHPAPFRAGARRDEERSRSCSS